MTVLIAAAAPNESPQPPPGGTGPNDEPADTEKVSGKATQADAPRIITPRTHVVVKLVGEDGNAFAIIARVRQALRRAGHRDLAEEFATQAMSGDYDHVLQTCMAFVIVE